jgi:iron complex outermembrane receptor protein
MKFSIYAMGILSLLAIPHRLAASVFDSDSAGVSDTLFMHVPVQLQEVTVTGTRSQHDAPHSSAGITPAMIRLSVATDSWDLLRQTSGLEIHEQGQGPGFASDASIRGFSSDHSTDIGLWVDGVPVNEPVNGHAEGYNDFSLLFPALIKDIEVVKGPTSPLYGNFAVAGAVNVRTLERVDSTSGSVSGGSNGRAEGTLVTGFDQGSTGGVVGLHSERDDGWRPNSGWQLGQLYLRSNFDLSAGTTIDGGIGLYGSSWNSPGFLTVDQFDHHLYQTVTNTSDGGFKRRAQERLSMRVVASPNLLWRTTLYATQGRWQLYLTIPPEPGSGEGTGSQTEEEDTRYGYGASSALTLFFPGGDLTAGVEGRLDHADYENWLTTSRLRDSAQSIVSARQISEAFFVQWNLRLFERIQISMGGRYDALSTLSQPDRIVSSTSSKGTLSPKVGVSYRLIPSTSLYTNVSQGFRQTDGVISDPTLPFITAVNYEVGIKFVGEPIAVNLALFRLALSNEQSFDPVTLSSTSNGASRRQGVDIDLDVRFSDDISLKAAWTYTDGVYTKLVTADGTVLTGAQIYNTSKYVGMMAFIVAPPERPWQLRLGLNLVGPYAPFDEPGVRLDAYSVFFLSGTYAFRDVALEAGIRNLFDAAYAELRAGGFVAPGQPRSAFGTVKFRL